MAPYNEQTVTPRIATPQQQIEMRAAHARNRHAMLLTVCARHKITPRGLAMMPAAALRRLVLAVDPKQQVDKLSDKRITDVAQAFNMAMTREGRADAVPTR